eukprot:CAMPEP_0182893028 /NCGR_PEP_ID=MMETSP0034_2-20130328/24231_1 /TAXON_ID=156128 /ORGANISM="Nephroselmis pyriformis, Strain CCMP717" /LENGTH=217 /DNA_ID=CAMNT_0025026747 /DNA_START=141 /DNA_END=791 /DNA_ORIENTATION=+
MNALSPVKVEVGGRARNFVARHLLAADDLQDALARATAPGLSVGHSYNIGEYSDPASIKIVNVETAPGGQSSVRALGGTEASNFFHANTYLQLDLPSAPGSATSSQHRQARASELPPPRDVGGALRVLGDTADASYPLFNNRTDDIINTLATVVFDLSRREARVMRGNPLEGRVDVVLDLARPGPQGVQLPRWAAPPVGSFREEKVGSFREEKCKTG